MSAVIEHAVPASRVTRADAARPPRTVPRTETACTSARVRPADGRRRFPDAGSVPVPRAAEQVTDEALDRRLADLLRCV